MFLHMSNVTRIQKSKSKESTSTLNSRTHIFQVFDQCTVFKERQSFCKLLCNEIILMFILSCICRRLDAHVVMDCQVRLTAHKFTLNYIFARAFCIYKSVSDHIVNNPSVTVHLFRLPEFQMHINQLIHTVSFLTLSTFTHVLIY